MAAKPDSIHPDFLTRRDFLKLGGFAIGLGFSLSLPASFKELIGLHSSSLTPARAAQILKTRAALDPGQQGRVCDDSIDVFDIPSFDGNRVNTYWRDRVIPITEVTINPDTKSHNIVWYRIADEGYAHSGFIQPVRTSLNPVVEAIPQGGLLAEVTVPFTDARWTAGKDQPVAYRYYYDTTYWVIETVHDTNGEAWYRVLDDKWEFTYYVLAVHLRLIPIDELGPLSTDTPDVLKRIEVHIPEQVMIAYEFERPVFMARVATGAKFSNGDFSTPAGRHITFHKQASRHMAAGNLAFNGYDLPGVPWNSYITEEGIAFHGTYWHNNFGKPRSHGCINLSPQAAKWVYRWTVPPVPPDQMDAYENYGTAVDIIS